MKFSWAWRDEGRRIHIARMDDDGLGEEFCSIHLPEGSLPQIELDLEDRAQAICDALNQSCALAAVAEEHQNKLDSNPDTFDFAKVMDDISDALAESDGDYIARIHNQICSNQIVYAGDSLWSPVHESVD